jgi:hypothetical protein
MSSRNFYSIRGMVVFANSLLNHSALALFAQRTRIPTSARSIGFCAIWVCISSSSIYQRIYDKGPEGPEIEGHMLVC